MVKFSRQTKQRICQLCGGRCAVCMRGMGVVGQCRPVLNHATTGKELVSIQFMEMRVYRLIVFRNHLQRKMVSLHRPSQDQVLQMVSYVSTTCV